MVVVHQLKGKKVLSYLQSRSADIAFLQETHFENGTEALKMKRDWVGKVFHNSVSRKSRGAIILINKKINFVPLREFKDTEGRVICLQVLINGAKVILCNIYARNREDPNFVAKIIKILGDFEGQIVLGGDFNQVPDQYLDRSGANLGPSTKNKSAAAIFKEEAGLVDIWRLVLPLEREYKFYSHSHKSYSRIDYF